jgi:hypothetical protein
MKSAFSLLAAILFASACAPGAPKGPAGAWLGERIWPAESKDAQPEGGPSDQQEGPSISSGLTEALGGDSLELEPGGGFLLKMAGAEVAGGWSEKEGFILLTPKTVMGKGPEESPKELQDFFEPVSLGASPDGSELVLAESGPWPGLRFRRRKS